MGTRFQRVRLRWHYANIVAGAINDPVVIGRTAKGAIVAVGRPDDPNTPGVDETLPGHIESVDIGNAVLTPAQSVYEVLTPGMVGIGCGVPESMDPEFWFGNLGSVCSDPGFWIDGFYFDGRALDGAVRASESIGSVNVFRMTALHFSDPATGRNDVKPSGPRIEAPVIGSLTIGDLREGVVWSGVLDFDAQSGFEILSNDFAQVGQLSVGCIGPAADLWFQGVTTADISGDVLGEIHVPSIGYDQTIRIGGRLAAWQPSDLDNYYPEEPLAISELTCGDEHYALLGAGDESPRDALWSGEVQRGAGAIRILQPGYLKGQIVVNANNETPTISDDGWEGWVIIGDNLPSQSPPAGQHILRPGVLQPDKVPYYSRLPVDPVVIESLGGGAVGLVPFNMHGLACTPPYDGVTRPVKLISDFFHSGPNPANYFDILIEHYGPIKGGTDPIAVDMWNATTGDWDVIDGLDQIVTVETALDDPALNNRTIRISPKSEKIKGIYRFRPGSTLVCADILSTNDVPVYPWQYQIDLRPDCDSDGIEDPPTGPDTDTSSCLSGPLCCDVDGTPGVNVFDLLFYLDCWFPSAACAEWTDDDPPAIDVFDLLAYLDCWFAQTPCL